MQLFQIRKMDGSKTTIIIPKIIGISEEVSTENVEYADEEKQTEEFKLANSFFKISER